MMNIENAKLDATYHLIDPNVGDGEVAKIEFNNPNVLIEIRLRGRLDGSVCAIEIVRCRYFSCVTSHPQNVIDGLLICHTIDCLSNALDDKSRQCLIDELKWKPGKIMRIIPNTGPDLICLGDDIRLMVSRP